jgi:hypothetical protein
MNINAVAILIVHAVVAVLCLAIYRGFPSTPKNAFLGYYLVLMPAGFAVWENAAYGLQAAFAVIGLAWITFAVARDRKQADRAADD